MFARIGMLNNLSDNLNAEAEGESSLTAHNNIHITSVIGFLSAMRDILDVRTLRCPALTLDLTHPTALGTWHPPAHDLPRVLQIRLRSPLGTSSPEHPPTTDDSHDLAARRRTVIGQTSCILFWSTFLAFSSRVAHVYQYVSCSCIIHTTIFVPAHSSLSARWGTLRWCYY